MKSWGYETAHVNRQPNSHEQAAAGLAIRRLLHGTAGIRGHVERLGVVAAALVAECDEAQCLAMLVRRDGETLDDLLRRRDAAIADAYENDRFADEIKAPPTSPMGSSSSPGSLPCDDLVKRSTTRVRHSQSKSG